MRKLIPPEMCGRKRPLDPCFSPEEYLYIRFKELLGDMPSPSGIRIPNQSVNRSKHGGQPEWVLLPDWLNWGYGSFKVADIPPFLMSDSGQVRFNFRVEHDPKECNYYHSEIRAYRDTDVQPLTKISGKNKEMKATFRMIIAERIQPLKMPD
jgi:hypothetical protein